jgi:hypothetical protein
MKTKTLPLLVAILLLVSAVTVTFSIATISACDDAVPQIAKPSCDLEDPVCEDHEDLKDEWPCDTKDEGQDTSSCGVEDTPCGDDKPDCGEDKPDCEPEPPCPPPPCQPGCGSPGYWKNHPEAWPVDAITIGGIEYSKDEAITLMEGDGDMTRILFMHLVAAKLNVLIGNKDSCVADTIGDADTWLSANPVGSGVNGSDEAWKTGEPLKDFLDAYNNGQLCAPKRK